MYAISIPNLVEIRKVNLNSLLISPGMTRMCHVMYSIRCVVCVQCQYTVRVTGSAKTLHVSVQKFDPFLNLKFS